MLNIVARSTAIGAAAVFACSAWQGAKASETVPFVGCPSDGQLGPIAAPKGAAKAVEDFADEVAAPEVPPVLIPDDGATTPRKPAVDGSKDG